MRAVLPKLQSYVSFVFSPAFINESKIRETHLVEEEKVTAIKHGTLARVLEKYREVEVRSRDLSDYQSIQQTLRELLVPKGALYFYFYSRWTVDFCSLELQSKPENKSALCYLENEGVLFFRGWLEEGTKYPDLPLERRKQLLALMDKHDSGNCTRILQILSSGGWDSEENFPLGKDDLLIRPDQVQMVDTEIPWPNK